VSFKQIVNDIPSLGIEWHGQTLLENTQRNFGPHPFEIFHDILRIDPNENKCLIISAGPSLYRQKSLEKIGEFEGTIISTDGAYIQCLRHEIVPDYVITIDPHPTRIVRWFGDPNLDDSDDYFQRQDLDVSFRENAEKTNAENIKLVDSFKVPLIIASSAPKTLCERTSEQDRYWFVPLVDNPQEEGLTRKMVEMTHLPAMNTGGTVGNCAWVFAHSILKSKDIAIIGCDMGYYEDLPLKQTQSWGMLKDKENPRQYYPHEVGGFGLFYTDPTYFWYRQNLRDLLKANNGRIANCTEGGLLYGSRIDCMKLEKWLQR